MEIQTGLSRPHEATSSFLLGFALLPFRWLQPLLTLPVPPPPLRPSTAPPSSPRRTAVTPGVTLSPEGSPASLSAGSPCALPLPPAPRRPVIPGSTAAIAAAAAAAALAAANTCPDSRPGGSHAVTGAAGGEAASAVSVVPRGIVARGVASFTKSAISTAVPAPMTIPTAGNPGGVNAAAGILTSSSAGVGPVSATAAGSAHPAAPSSPPLSARTTVSSTILSTATTLPRLFRARARSSHAATTRRTASVAASSLAPTTGTLDALLSARAPVFRVDSASEDSEWDALAAPAPAPPRAPGVGHRGVADGASAPRGRAPRPSSALSERPVTIAPTGEGAPAHPTPPLAAATPLFAAPAAAAAASTAAAPPTTLPPRDAALTTRSYPSAHAVALPATARAFVAPGGSHPPVPALGSAPAPVQAPPVPPLVLAPSRFAANEALADALAFLPRRPPVALYCDDDDDIEVGEATGGRVSANDADSVSSDSTSSVGPAEGDLPHASSVPPRTARSEMTGAAAQTTTRRYPAARRRATANTATSQSHRRESVRTAAATPSSPASPADIRTPVLTNPTAPSPTTATASSVAAVTAAAARAAVAFSPVGPRSTPRASSPPPLPGHRRGDNRFANGPSSPDAGPTETNSGGSHEGTSTAAAMRERSSDAVWNTATSSPSGSPSPRRSPLPPPLLPPPLPPQSPHGVLAATPGSPIVPLSLHPRAAAASTSSTASSPHALSISSLPARRPVPASPTGPAPPPALGSPLGAPSPAPAAAMRHPMAGSLPLVIVPAAAVTKRRGGGPNRGRSADSPRGEGPAPRLRAASAAGASWRRSRAPPLLPGEVESNDGEGSETGAEGAAAVAMAAIGRRARNTTGAASSAARGGADNGLDDNAHGAEARSDDDSARAAGDGHHASVNSGADSPTPEEASGSDGGGKEVEDRASVGPEERVAASESGGSGTVPEEDEEEEDEPDDDETERAGVTMPSPAPRVPAASRSLGPVPTPLPVVATPGPVSPVVARGLPPAVPPPAAIPTSTPAPPRSPSVAGTGAR